jgi:P27 family predicted phage terminase small subunit
VKLARGNPGKRALNPYEPQPSRAESLEPPEFLGEGAQAEWRQRAATFERLGLLTELDLDAFAVYCQSMATWKKAMRHLDEDGMVTNGAYPMISPWASIAAKACGQVMKVLVEFGLTPSSRTRVAVNKVPHGDGDARKERFFGPRPRLVRKNPVQ